MWASDNKKKKKMDNFMKKGLFYLILLLIGRFKQKSKINKNMAHL